MDLSNSTHDFEADDIQNLIHLLEYTKDPTIQEQVLITLSNSAAFSVNQDTIRNLGGLSVVGKMLSVPVTNIKEKALNALNNLSMNIKNQEVVKVKKVFGYSVSAYSEVQVLKLLVNLSANPAMTEHLLNAQAPFLLSLCDSCTNKDVLLRVLVFITNLTKHMKKDKSTVHSEYNEDSVFSVLWGNSTLCAQKLASLLHHNDTEVREQVAELIMQQC
ncbi:hypothetical protein JD844_027597 [Phrynosoma platyrhinos]|uniref:Armadillo repeat-containing domain-containing protein n=1 Tax=Phrynosoma platyrhinos TaxID=52577 RepID=A0ABQ7SGP5_PHRPL|nr:hypothetical protein JD844_027597 [Phrynosoma platyrhinos]